MSADPSFNTKNYMDQGGAGWHVGGTLTIESGGVINEAAGAIRQVGGLASPSTATFTPAAGTTNVSLVSIQLKDNAGNNVAAVANIDIYLSDSATGVGLTTTTASGAVAAGASGVDLVDYVSKKAKRVQTTAAGLYILSITDSAKTGFFVAAQIGNSRPAVSAQLITANYG